MSSENEETWNCKHMTSFALNQITLIPDWITDECHVWGNACRADLYYKFIRD
jgi:hypothetical protein